MLAKVVGIRRGTLCGILDPRADRLHGIG
jgi:hypothetical protein